MIRPFSSTSIDKGIDQYEIAKEIHMIAFYTWTSIPNFFQKNFKKFLIIDKQFQKFMATNQADNQINNPCIFNL